MKTRTARRIGWSAVALFLLLAGAGLWLLVAGQGAGEAVDDFFFVAVFLAFVVVGALIVSTQPGNTIGWLFVGIALWAALMATAGAYAQYALARGVALSGVMWSDWLASWGWIGMFGPTLIFLPLLFPDGRLPSRRWLPMAMFAGAFLAFGMTVMALDPANPDLSVPNPVGVEAFRGLAATLDSVGILVPLGLAIGSVSSLVLRYRRSDRAARQQIKWFLFGVGLMVTWLLLSVMAGLLGAPDPVVESIDTVAAVIAFMSLPVGVGIGILRHRLLDIDVVIRKTVVFAILAVILTVVFGLLALGLGGVVGILADPQGATLTIAAAFLLGLLTVPLWRLSRRIADRVVFGGRANPYEVLTTFGERMAQAYSSEDVIPRMASVLGTATRATRAAVWVRVGSELRPAGTWPGEDAELTPLPMAGDALPPFGGGEYAVEVRHHGDLLGALSVRMPASDPMNASKEKLVRDLARQAGLVLRNVRLIEELRASRKRLVAAQDQERRRLERNIHDGAQQQLVALAVKLRLVETLAAKEPQKAAEIAGQAKAELQEALEDLRDLARGIYPPLLADKGLSAALEAQARKSPLPVEIHPDGVGRYPAEAEAAVYFCVLEALQNAAKYAGANKVEVRLEAADGELRFAVIDDGRGFDLATTAEGTGLQNMADRVEALGGSLEIRSAPGEGTSVAGRVPATGEEDIA